MALGLTRSYTDYQRRDALARYEFPAALRSRLKKRFPQYSYAQWALVLEGLRDWFALNLAARGERLAMPSQAVDEAWHEFILFTREYAAFCHGVMGRFVHHVPAEAMETPTHAQIGIRRAWRLACERERIRPRQPSRLPMLFALDAELAFPGGFRYALDCVRDRPLDANRDYCAVAIGCTAAPGGGSDGIDFDAGGSCSGGDGGGGCGGCGGD